MEKVLPNDADAERSAAEKIAALLNHPDQLLKLDELKRSLVAKKTASEAQLKGAVQVQLDETSSGMELMRHSLMLIGRTRSSFQKIDALCRDCQDLIDEYPLVRKVNLVKNNLSLTLKELQKMRTIPQKVATLREWMEDDSNILHVHQHLRELEAQRGQVLEQVKEFGEEHAALQRIFREVDRVSDQFEKLLWRLAANCLQVAQEQPAVLVKVAQVVFREEKRAIEAAEKAPMARDEAASVRVANITAPTRDYLSELREVLKLSIQRRFDETFDMSRDDVTEALTKAEMMLDDLTCVLDDVVPCFPKTWQIFELFAHEYHKRFFSMLLLFAQPAKDVGNNGFINLLTWVKTKYEPQVTRLNESADLQPPLVDALDALVVMYRRNVQNLMKEWSERLLAQDCENAPEIVNGLYCTHFPVTLFQSVDSQISIASTTGCWEFVVEVVLECAASLSTVQEQLEMLLKEKWMKLDISYLLAVINNCNKCCDHTQDLHDKAQSIVLEHTDTEQTVDFDSVSDGFHRTAKQTCEFVADKILVVLEPAILALFDTKWYDDEEEAADHPLEQIVVTLDDFFSNDIQPHLEGVYFKRLALICLQRTVTCYVQQLCSAKRQFDGTTVERMRKDYDLLLTFFLKQTLREKQVLAELRLLQDLRDMLDADAESVCIYFESIYKNYPKDGILSVVKGLLQNRKDFDRTQVTAALAGCEVMLKQLADKMPPTDTTTIPVSEKGPLTGVLPVNSMRPNGVKIGLMNLAIKMVEIQEKMVSATQGEQ